MSNRSQTYDLGYDDLTTCSALPMPSIQDIMAGIVAARKTEAVGPRPGDFSTSYNRPLSSETWKHLDYRRPMTTPEQKQLYHNLGTFLIYYP